MRLLADAAKDASSKASKGEFSQAIDVLAKVGAKSEKWADCLKEELKADKQKVVEAAQAALDKIAETKTTDLEQAKKDIAALATKLKGTGLEEKAKTLLSE